MSFVKVITFYKFFIIKDIYRFSREIERVALKENLFGTFFVTPEGINTTLSGSEKGLTILLNFLRESLGVDSIKPKWTESTDLPFKRLKIRTKPSLLPLQGNFNVLKKRGVYVKPSAWNKIILDPKITLLDVRNKYETKLGTFKNSFNPKISTFIDFPQFVEQELELKLDKDKKIAMFCTGGIRCEIASSYMLNKGFKNVYQLEGGILNYLEQVDKKNHLWDGECFVFDERVSVGRGLESGKYIQCFGCRHPLSEKDVKSADYVKGVACSYCINKTSVKDKLRFQERQKQIDLAIEKGANHFGDQ